METFVTAIFGILLFAAGLFVLALVLWILYAIGLLFSGLYLLLQAVLGVLLPFGTVITSEAADESQPSPSGTTQRGR